MITAKVTSKGQITLPKAIREKLGVHAGEDVGFEEKDGIFFVKKVIRKSPFDKWAGRLKHLEGRESDDLIRTARGHDTHENRS